MIILGLGSNIGDRLAHLRQAVAALSAVISDMRCSRIFQSAALLPLDAPTEWDLAFYNMAVSGLTKLSPLALLEEIKAIEARLGRQKRGAWGPREIDIDILAMDDGVMESNELTIPHRELLNRDFALLPLVDVAPDWHFPLLGDYYRWRAADIAADKQFSLHEGLQDTGYRIDD